MFGHRYFGAAYFGPRYWGPGATTPAPTDTDLGRNMFGGGEAEFEEYKARRRARERDLEEKERSARELRARLAQAEADLQKKAKAKKESKARKALQERIERFEDQIAEAELQITAIMIEIKNMEMEAARFQMIDRRKRLLLLTALMQ